MNNKKLIQKETLHLGIDRYADANRYPGWIYTKTKGKKQLVGKIISDISYIVVKETSDDYNSPAFLSIKTRLNKLSLKELKAFFRFTQITKNNYYGQMEIKQVFDWLKKNYVLVWVDRVDDYGIVNPHLLLSPLNSQIAGDHTHQFPGYELYDDCHCEGPKAVGAIVPRCCIASGDIYNGYVKKK